MNKITIKTYTIKIESDIINFYRLNLFLATQGAYTLNPDLTSYIFCNRLHIRGQHKKAFNFNLPKPMASTFNQIKDMEHTPGSINKDCTSLDVERIERDRVQEESSKLYQQATADAKFLRNVSTKQESNTERVHPFSSDTVPFRSRTVGHQEYAMYRQKYLVMYSPFRSFKNEGEKKCMKEKINMWLAVKSSKKQSVKTETKTAEPKYKSSSSAGFLESVLRFLRLLGEWRGQW